MPSKLDRYAAKRDLTKTPEPRAELGRTGETAIFTVQKHNASHLHYDFRLEHAGVLLSWAVPKGPSYDPTVKRLAVQVEDHPVSYAKFEGAIPEGEYGAGTVLVWDFGTWRPQGDVEQMLHEGVLKFELMGRRMHGLWALIQMHGSKDWLLIKERDGQELKGDKDGVVLRYTDSVLHEIEPTDLKPESVRPQLATMSLTTPRGPEWLHEVKFDGYRVLAWRIGDSTRLITRGGLDWTSHFTEIAQALAEILPSGVTVDGEVVVFDDKGRSDFGLLQRWLKEKKGRPGVFVAFDLLIHEGASIMARPLLERKRILQGMISTSLADTSLVDQPLRFSEHIEGDGEGLFESACKLNLEGIVSKRKDAPYVQDRTKTWLKRKCSNREEFVVGGFSRGKGTRGELGAILLGQFSSDGVFEYRGKVGTGFDESDLKRLHDRLKPLTITQKPFAANLDSVPSGATWVTPSVVVEIKFAERTRSGLIRQGVFVGEREDKGATEVHPEMVKKDSVKSKVIITHPERVLFAEGGVTKAELADYYESVADLMLPTLANRPLAVVRCPDGTEGECFFQKHVGAGMPPSVGQKVEEGEANMIVIRDRDDLMSLVQFGVIELHPWGSKVKTLEQPDTLILDLDPGPGVSWETVIGATLAVHERLSALDLPSFLKTSGGKGFHVVVPIHPGDLSWADFKELARAIAEDMDRLVPDVFVTNMAKSKRKGRIFLDYLRNGRGATSVAAFSVRARANAPASVPIAWTEIAKLPAANTYTVRNAPDWLSRYDPKVWEGSLTPVGHVTEQTWKLLQAEPPT